MLSIVCALACEARPLISHFGLRLNPLSSSFSLYESDAIRLIISGVGKIHTATAIGYLHGFKGNLAHSAWLNVGIAGHATLPLGTGLLAHQIIDQASQQRYYPTFVMDRPVSTTTIWTVDKPETTFATDGIYEMEASAFWAAASRFSTAELIHCYKVISDNRTQSFTALKPQQVEEWITLQIPHLEHIINSLQTLSQRLQALELPEEELIPFLTRWHFTITQQHTLKRLLQRWKASFPLHTRELWNDQLRAFTKSRHVLSYLEEILGTHV